MTPAPFPRAFGRGWLVMEKPCGMSVHNTPGRDLLSFTEMLLEKKKDPLFRKKPQGFGLHPVHRLDAETSGLILLAFEKEAFRQLSLQFEKRRVEKTYLALVHGIPRDPEGVWTFPLSPRAEGRKNPQGAGERQACETRYALLRASDRHSLLRCTLCTGRTHQIRRHAALAGHPLAGDTRYAPLRALKYLTQNWPGMRLGLEAQALRFQPPEAQESLTVEIPDIPEAFMQLLESASVSSFTQQKNNGCLF